MNVLTGIWNIFDGKKRTIGGLVLLIAEILPESEYRELLKLVGGAILGVGVTHAVKKSRARIRNPYY